MLSAGPARAGGGESRPAPARKYDPSLWQQHNSTRALGMAAANEAAR